MVTLQCMWLVLVITYLLLKVCVYKVRCVSCLFGFLLHKFGYCSKVHPLFVHSKVHSSKCYGKKKKPYFDKGKDLPQKANLWVQGQDDPVCSRSQFCDFHQLWRRPAVARPALKAAAELNAAARLQCRAEILSRIFVRPPTFAPTFTGCLSARRTDGPYQ